MTSSRFFALPYFFLFFGATALRAETTPLIQNPFLEQSLQYSVQGYLQDAASVFRQTWWGHVSSQSVLLPTGQRVSLVRTVIMPSGMGGSAHFDQNLYWIFAANRFFDIRQSLEEGSPSVGQGYCIENHCHTTVRLGDELTEMTYISDATKCVCLAPLRVSTKLSPGLAQETAPTKSISPYPLSL